MFIAAKPKSKTTMVLINTVILIGVGALRGALVSLRYAAINTVPPDKGWAQPNLHKKNLFISA